MGRVSAHFREAELACPCCGVNGVQTALLNMLELYREQIGGPLLVLSAFRCPVENARVGGAAHSQHLLGLAADVRAPGRTPAEMEALAHLVPAIHGLGRADHQGYIHLDTRTELPLAGMAKWCYGVDGKECPYYPPET